MLAAFRLPVVAAVLLVTSLPARSAEPGSSKSLSGGSNAAHTDQYGDSLPASALARLGTSRLRHAGSIQSIAFSPDGRTLASGSSDRTVRLWEARTGRLLRMLVRQQHEVWCVAFTPDGKRLAFGSWEKIVLWDLAAGRLLRQWIAHGSRIESLAFSADGTVLASAAMTDPILRCWDVKTGREICHFAAQYGLHSLAFAPEGKSLATAAANPEEFRLWDAATGREVRRFRGHRDAVTAVAFAPDGRTFLSGSEDRTLRLWDVATGKELRRFRGHTAPVHAVAFAPDGKRVASGAGDGTVRVWEVASGKEVRRLRAHPQVFTVAFAPDGKTLAAGGGDQPIYERDGSDNSIHLWETATGKERGPVAPRASITAVALAPDGRVVASGGGDGGVCLWERATAQEMRRLGQHGGAVSSLAFALDGRTLVSGGGDSQVTLWDVAAGKERDSFSVLPGFFHILGPGEGRACVAFSPDGRMLASGSGLGTVTLRALPDLKEVRRFKARRAPISSLAFAPDGKSLVTASSRGNEPIRLWQTATGKELRAFTGQPFGIESVAFTADGASLLSAGLTTFCTWDAATGKRLGQTKAHEGQVHALAISPDGKTVATGGEDRLVRLWESATGKERGRLAGHEGEVSSLAFAADGTVLVSGSDDTTALVWDLTGMRSENVLTDGPPARTLETLWQDLGSDDAAVAFRAVQAMAADPGRAVPFLKNQLPSVPSLEREVTRLIAALDDEQFPVRERATRELERAGHSAAPALRRALQVGVSLEVRRRIERLLRGLEVRPNSRLPTATLRGLRAVEALERIGGREVQPILEALANRLAGDLLSREAAATLRRLAQRSVRR